MSGGNELKGKIVIKNTETGETFDTTIDIPADNIEHGIKIVGSLGTTQAFEFRSSANEFACFVNLKDVDRGDIPVFWFGDVQNGSTQVKTGQKLGGAGFVHWSGTFTRKERNVTAYLQYLREQHVAQHGTCRNI